MGRYRIRCLLFHALGVLATSCGGVEASGEDVGDEDFAIEASNALNPNALNPNALNPNALDPSALAAAALSFGTLVPSAKSAILAASEAGQLSRQLLTYVVSCALDPSQSLGFSWTDGSGQLRQETYWGMLGLATAWSYRVPSTSEQQWVSACLASRVNRYGVSVTISSRASNSALNKAGSDELTSYPVEEGAFWGNLFTPSPSLFACYIEPNRQHARDLWRACAAGHVGPSGIEECGIIEIVGSCVTHCEPLQPVGLYRPECDDDLSDGQSASGKVISTFLP